MSVKLRNINPMGQVDVPVLGRQGKPFGEKGRGCLEPGEVIAVSEETAGEAPHWRAAEEGDADEDGVIRRYATRVEDDLLEVWDLGHGLLAQTDNFELVKKEDPTKGLTVEQLKDYAAEHNIELGDATTKADIAAVIRKAV